LPAHLKSTTIATADTFAISDLRFSEPIVGINVSHGVHHAKGFQRIVAMDNDDEMMVHPFMREEDNAMPSGHNSC
jgi:hypothetical protein